MNLAIRQLSAVSADPYFDFFDNRAFIDNPDWSGCYCTLFHYSGTEEEWEKRTGEQNRIEAGRLIESGALRGYLAFDENKPVGWCNVNRKTEYPRLVLDERISFPDDSSTVSVVCFTIDPAYRGRGIATALLSRAVEDYREEAGITLIEAYPQKNMNGPAENYVGPLGLYRKLGFIVFRELEDVIVMRKSV